MSGQQGRARYVEESHASQMVGQKQTKNPSWAAGGLNLRYFVPREEQGFVQLNCGDLLPPTGYSWYCIRTDSAQDLLGPLRIHGPAQQRLVARVWWEFSLPAFFFLNTF